MEAVINNPTDAKTALSKFVSENNTDGIDEKEFVKEQMYDWEREKHSVEYEIERTGTACNYRIDRAIDLYFLIEAGKEFLK